MASAKFANSTVNHSHKVICRPKPNAPIWCSVSRTNSIVVKTAPTSTTNMTGFFTMMRGWSFANESTIARITIFLSASGLAFSWADKFISSSECLSCGHEQVLEDWPETQRREERQCAHNQNSGDEQGGKQSTGYRERPCRFGNSLFSG